MSAEDLGIVGLALRVERKTFDKIVDGFRLHSHLYERLAARYLERVAFQVQLRLFAVLTA
jgi:hypothetical protein